jgi:LmbE family N-acetylglucosaminyl deacetylase
MIKFIKDIFNAVQLNVLKVWIIFFIKKFKYKLSGKNLILIPHPDDEILGVGGFLLRILKNNGIVHLVYLTNGENSNVWNNKDEIKKQRIILSEKVISELKLNDNLIIRLNLPDGSVPRERNAGFNEIVDQIKEIIDTIQPDNVFSTHHLDYWPYDHVACSQIALEAVKQSAHKPQLWFYWVWAWYNLRPWQLFRLNSRHVFKVNIRDEKAKKIELMDIYLKALTPDGKPWSGVLPTALIKASRFPVEIIEKIEY